MKDYYEDELNMLNIEICSVDELFDDKSVIENCILEIRFNTKAMIDNDCIEYSFINTVVAQQMCETLGITSLRLNKSREVKKYDERRDKNITHAIYSSMIIRNHTKSSTSLMIIELDQHSIILEKSWMRKHEVSYHDHSDIISFKTGFCTHMRASEFLFLIQFIEKTLNHDLMKIKEFKSIAILKRSSQSTFNERRRKFNESWRKKLEKIKTSLSEIRTKESFDKELRNELYKNWKIYQRERRKSTIE
jgi:bifunctional DNA-binding transcriptional regulator/antitoxin component of YhaV-PrlF toxin-antitoxin module